MEEFKDYKYGYKVSNHGRVLNRYGVELKCSIMNRGYRYFQTRKQGKRENHLIHQVVGLLFIGERPKEENGKDYVIDHIDRNKLNNHIDNLRYITFKENIRNCDRYNNEVEEQEPKKRNNILSKLYNKKNADEIKRKKREYYNKNRERIKEYGRAYYRKNYIPKYVKPPHSIDCECGGHYVKQVKSRHLKQKIHTDYINSKETAKQNNLHYNIS